MALRDSIPSFPARVKIVWVDNTVLEFGRLWILENRWKRARNIVEAAFLLDKDRNSIEEFDQKAQWRFRGLWNRIMWLRHELTLKDHVRVISVRIYLALSFLPRAFIKRGARKHTRRERHTSTPSVKRYRLYFIRIIENGETSLWKIVRVWETVEIFIDTERGWARDRISRIESNNYGTIYILARHISLARYKYKSIVNSTLHPLDSYKNV